MNAKDIMDDIIKISRMIDSVLETKDIDLSLQLLDKREILIKQLNESTDTDKEMIIRENLDLIQDLTNHSKDNIQKAKTALENEQSGIKKKKHDILKSRKAYTGYSNYASVNAGSKIDNRK